MPAANHVQREECPVVVEPGPESAVLEAALDGWRHRVSDIVLAVLAAALLPAVVLVALGYGPPAAPLPKTVVFGAYLLFGAASLLRHFDYRHRVQISILALYLILVIGILVNPTGPYVQVAVVTIPICGLVLLGHRAARVGVVASTALIVLAPVLRQQPGVMHLLGIDPAQAAEPPNLVWYRAIVEAAFLFALTVLLARFHRFLLHALAQRIAAQRKMEEEMNERQRLEREIAAASEKERCRLGRELHDGVCQLVTAALLRCRALERRLERGGELSGADFAPLSSLLADTINDAHNVSRGLCPLEPDPDALAPALRALTRRMQEMAAVPCGFLAVGDVRVADPEAAQHLYRIAQEALSNAARHARASRIAVELRGNEREVTLQIEDDGAGLPPDLPPGGMGLRTMAYRARVMDGALTVGPAPGGGTRVTCRVPISAGGRAAGQHA